MPVVRAQAGSQVVVQVGKYRTQQLREDKRGKMKIITLTEEQTAQLAVYRNAWTEKGLSTAEVTSDAEIHKTCKALNNLLGRGDTPVVIMGNPLTTWLAVCLLSGAQVGGYVREDIGEEVWGQVKDQVWAQIGEEVRAQVGEERRAQIEEQVWVQAGDQLRAQAWEKVSQQVLKQVGEHIGEQVWNQTWQQILEQVGEEVVAQIEKQVGEQVRQQVWQQVGEQVWHQVVEQVGEDVRRHVGRFIWPYIGNYNLSSFFAQFDFFRDVLGVKDYPKDYEILRQGLKIGLFYPLERFTAVCRKPTSIALKNGKLHCEDGPALVYDDNWKLYALDGVRATEAIVRGKQK